MLGGMLQIID